MPRRAPLRGAIVVAVVLVAAGMTPTAHAATVESYRAQIAHIRDEIAAKGAEIEALVGETNASRARLDSLHQKISSDERLLTADARVERAASALVRRAAAVAYIGYGSGSGTGLSFFDDTSSITHAMGARQYLNAVNAHLDDTLAQLEIAKGRTDDDRTKLVAQQKDAQQVLDHLLRAQSDANAAISAQNATLQHVTGQLTALLVSQKKQKQAQARLEAQRAVAAALASAASGEDAAPTDDGGTEPGASVAQTTPVSRDDPPPTSRPPVVVPPSTTPVSPGQYLNPFRATGGLSPERIDSGVDYAGVGPVYAIGNGQVVNVYASDWPGGTFIAYQLSDGPAAGLVVYTAEDIDPQVSVGSSVTANTVIGQMYGGPNGIEIGWADGAALPNAMARSAGQYHGGNSTAFGYNFSQLLQALGAPGGILQNSPTGTLPAGWPEWS